MVGIDYSLKDLRALEALLRERHVSQAAARLGMSQPAMSMTLKRLREVFDDPLLIRQGNKHVLTDVARGLHERVQILIREMEGLVDDSGGFDPRHSRRTFTLILTDYIDAILIPSLQQRFRELAPHVKLRVVGPDPFRLARVFGEGSVDLTVSYFPDAPGDLISRRVFSDRMVCLARSGNPAIAGPLTLAGFCDLDHVAIEPAEATMYRAVLDEALAKMNLIRRVAISKPDFVGVPFLLERSDLVATMPERLAKLFTARFDLITFSPPIDLPPLDIQMMWHKSTHLSPAHVWLREQVIEVCRRQSPDAGDMPQLCAGTH
ncbi:LysR family transcriptional regulator [Stappia sp.]|uniref:LysR family transcriptional regulator n=1 Tax=Stappia sp. TaxID=1870903 RepID=UPI003D0CBE38